MSEAADRLGRASLPSVSVVLDQAAAAPIHQYGKRVIAEAIRAELSRLRNEIADDAVAPEPSAVLAAAVVRLEQLRGRGVQRVINATGVVIHTNLGRAPLSDAAREAVVAASGYATVEYDLVTGARGSRTAHVGSLAAELCGADAGTAVNNGAAALLLAVAGLARGREVIVSRGELVEIGGSFRLPDIIAAGGARLVEVGTTNRTRAADYRSAIGPDTGLILKVHPSNFRLIGFTEHADLAELVALGREHDVPVVFDAGSGLIDDQAAGLLDDPVVREAVGSGADLVLFSGDKLLGGPQAGLLVGSREAVARCRTEPLARALRIDKLQVAALEATLLAHLRSPVPHDIPVIRMLHEEADTLRARATSLADTVARIAPSADVSMVELGGVVGGGAAPGLPVTSFGVRVQGPDASRFAGDLRQQDPPVIVRVEDGAVLLDVRTILDEEVQVVADAVRRCLPSDDT